MSKEGIRRRRDRGTERDGEGKREYRSLFFY